MSVNKVNHISNVSSKTAATIAAELSPLDQFGRTSPYNESILGAALFLAARGMEDYTYVSQGQRTTLWRAPDGEIISVAHQEALAD